MPERTRVGADHQQSPPKNPVYGLAAGFGRGGTVVGVGWTVGSAIGSSAKREMGSAGRPLGGRVLACELGWRESRARTASRGPKGELRSRVVALHREPAAPTTESEHR